MKETQILEENVLPLPSKWLIRIATVFEEMAPEVIARLGATASKKLGHEFYWIETSRPEAVTEADVSMFLRWNLPLQHSWPCHPQKMENFVEKAAQTLLKKFGGQKPQSILVGQLNPSPSHMYYRGLASNLRGRLLQLFPPLPVSPDDVEGQKSDTLTLFCLVGKEGLFCGMQSPQKSNGLYPGGTKFISQTSPTTISRAGAKVAEALHYLTMYRPPFEKESQWLELGASPGGMTSELLAREYHVTAVDRARMDKRLENDPRLTFALADVATFRPRPGSSYDAILCDMNGDAREAMKQVIRFEKFLKPKGVAIFTLKMPSSETVSEITTLFKEVLDVAKAGGLRLLAQTHLSYNRHEFTLFLEPDA